MIWKKPHISKIYEAITAIADARVELISANKAKVYSSKLDKFYEVIFEPESNSIMSNDNSAFYTGKLSYPMIALLMSVNVIPYEQTLLEPLKGIVWKQKNEESRNNYDIAIYKVMKSLKDKGFDIEKIKSDIETIYSKVVVMKFDVLGPKRFPPK